MQPPSEIRCPAIPPLNFLTQGPEICDAAPSSSPLSIGSSSSPLPHDTTQASFERWRTFCLNVQGDLQFSPPTNTCSLANQNALSHEIAQEMIYTTIQSHEFSNDMQLLATSKTFEKSDFQTKYSCFFNEKAEKMYRFLETYIKCLFISDSLIDILDQKVADDLQKRSFEDKAISFFFSEVHSFIFTHFYATDDTKALNVSEAIGKLLLQKIVLSQDSIPRPPNTSHTHFTTLNLVAQNLRYREKMLELIDGVKSMPLHKQAQLIEAMNTYEKLRETIDQNIIANWPESMKKLYIFLGSIDQQDLRCAFRSRIIQALRA